MLDIEYSEDDPPTQLMFLLPTVMIVELRPPKEFGGGGGREKLYLGRTVLQSVKNTSKRGLMPYTRRDFNGVLLNFRLFPKPGPRWLCNAC